MRSGATATGITAGVVLVAKFAEGAWITMLLIPLLLATMITVKKHYDAVSREIAAPMEFSPGRPERPLVVLPLKRWSLVAANALRFAMNVSPDVHAIHIDCEETEEMKRQWQEHVARPAREAGFAEPQLEIIPSPYRYVVTPIVEHILQLELKNPERTVAVVIPELVESHWYHYLLHNQRASLLKALLLVKGGRRIVVINVPWYLD